MKIQEPHGAARQTEEEKLMEKKERRKESQKEWQREYRKRKREGQSNQENEEERRKVADKKKAEREKTFADQSPKERRETRERESSQIGDHRAKQSDAQKERVKKKDSNRKQNKRQPNKKKRKRACDDPNDLDFSADIKKAVKRAKRVLHRTKDQDDPTKHRANVCIVCDCFISGTEPIRTMSKSELKAHRECLGVDEYEQYHKVKLKDELKKQYRVKNFDDMLLSRRSRRRNGGYVTCAHCRNSLRPDQAHKKDPPKYAISNGNVIGEFPKKIHIRGTKQKKRVINLEELSDEIRVLVAPSRPYACVFYYSAGAHRSIIGSLPIFRN